MDTYEDEMQRMLAQEMQQRARREQTSDAIAGAKENYAGAYAIPPLTPEERQLNADADAAAAIPLGEAAYKQKDQFYGQGLLGMGVAGLLNLGKKKKIANRVAIAGEGLWCAARCCCCGCVLRGNTALSRGWCTLLTRGSAVCEQNTSHNTQILACFSDQLG